MYLTPEARYIRKSVFYNVSEQQNHRCAYCGKKTWKSGTVESGNRDDMSTLEHLIPESVGGETSSENCIMACHWCNNTRGRESYTLFYNRIVLSKMHSGDDNKLMQIKYKEIIQQEQKIAKAIILFNWLYTLFPDIIAYIDVALSQCLKIYNVNLEELNA